MLKKKKHKKPKVKDEERTNLNQQFFKRWRTPLSKTLFDRGKPESVTQEWERLRRTLTAYTGQITQDQCRRHAA